MAGTAPRIIVANNDSTEKKSFAQVADTLVASAPEQSRSELYLEAGKLFATITTADSSIQAFEELKKILIEIEESKNPELYAKKRFSDALTAGTAGAGRTPPDFIKPFNSTIISKPRGSRAPLDPESVKLEGHRLLANKFIDDSGGIAKIDFTGLDALVANQGRSMGTGYCDAIRDFVKSEYVIRTKKMVEDYKSKYEAGTITTEEIERVIADGAVTNASLIEGLKGLIKDKIALSQLGVESARVATSVDGARFNINSLVASVTASPEFTSLNPNVQAIIKEDLDIQVQDRNETDKFGIINEKNTLRVKEIKGRRELLEAKRKEWVSRIKIFAKSSLLIGLIGASFGGVLTGVPEIANVIGYSGISSPLPGLVGGGILGFFVGGGISIFGLMKNDVDLQELILKRKAKDFDLEKVKRELDGVDNKYKKRELTASKAVAEYYAKLVAEVKGLPNEGDAFVKQVMGNTQFRGLDSILNISSGLLSG